MPFPVSVALNRWLPHIYVFPTSDAFVWRPAQIFKIWSVNFIIKSQEKSYWGYIIAINRGCKSNCRQSSSSLKIPGFLGCCLFRCFGLSSYGLILKLWAVSLVLPRLITYFESPGRESEGRWSEKKIKVTRNKICENNVPKTRRQVMPKGEKRRPVR